MVSKRKERTVIVGGGHAAGALLTALLQKKYQHEVVLVGNEPHPPYQRPPLSKNYLTGDNPDQFIIDRKDARNHMSFGYGVHRCMGNRLAELQLRILWEEILKRFDNIEVVEEPERVQSNFVRGYSRLMVKLTPNS